jgi:hypothetical protein
VIYLTITADILPSENKRTSTLVKILEFTKYLLIPRLRICSDHRASNVDGNDCTDYKDALVGFFVLQMNLVVNIRL